MGRKRKRSPPPVDRSVHDAPRTGRKWLVLVLVALPASVILVLSLLRLRPEPAAPKSTFGTPHPNVLLISVDTLRADYLGAYGGREAATPALDRLAAEGVVFENAVSHVALTLPSHASLFTSRIPPYHGVRDNATYRLHQDQTSLAETLQSSGYATAAFVGAFVLDGRFGLSQGFDDYDDDLGPSEEAERRADAVLASAQSWLERRDGNAPWFVFVHLFDPHAPYDAAPPFGTTYRDNPYAGEVAFVDSALGAFLERLRSAGRLENTLVVFTSDHGEGLGEHGEQTHGMFGYNSTLHVPLIAAAGHGVLPAGKRVSERVRLIDVAPTILDLVGVPVPETFQGRTLAGLAAGRDEDGDRTSYFEALTYSFNRGTAPLFGVYEETYKFISLPIPELYDLSADPSERENLAPARARKVYELAGVLQELISSPGAEPSRVPRSDIDASALDRMHVLGYIVVPSPLPGFNEEYGPDDDPKAWVHLANKLDEAVNLHRAGRLNEAKRLLREILAERPRVATAYARLARLLDEQGRPEEAIALLEDAVQQGVLSPFVVNQLGRLLQTSGREERWIEVLEAMVQAHPNDADAHEALAASLSRLGRLDSAIPHLERVVELRPDYATAALELGVAHFRAGRVMAAMPPLQRAVELDPSFGVAWSALGDLHAARNETPQALSAWRQAVEVDPAQYETMVRLGLALADSGRPEEALVYLQQFVDSAPEDIFREETRQVEELVQALREDLAGGR